MLINTFGLHKQTSDLYQKCISDDFYTSIFQRPEAFYKLKLLVDRPGIFYKD